MIMMMMMMTVVMVVVVKEKTIMTTTTTMMMMMILNVQVEGKVPEGQAIVTDLLQRAHERLQQLQDKVSA
jgi:hypothetical protein